MVTRLQDKGIATSLPLVPEVHRWSDRNRTVYVSVFPRYASVRIDACPEQRLRVLQTHGVLGFVGVREVGLPVPDKDEDIQTLVAQHECDSAWLPRKGGRNAGEKELPSRPMDMRSGPSRLATTVAVTDLI